MIGVNSWNHAPGELKEVMAKEKINWRTFDDSGAINDGWNPPMTPAFYVIDHDGVLRHKWVGKPGAKTIDAALERLIQEAEKAKTSF